MDGTGVGGTLADSYRLPGGGLRSSSSACGEKTRGPNALERSGQAADSRRSNALGGHCSGAQSPSGGEVAQRPRVDGHGVCSWAGMGNKHF